jgi:hypothetical protein
MFEDNLLLESSTAVSIKNVPKHRHESSPENSEWSSNINCPSMGRLSNSVSVVTELWKRTKHLKNPENGNSTFTETSGRASTARYQVHEDFSNQEK